VAVADLALQLAVVLEALALLVAVVEAVVEGLQALKHHLVLAVLAVVDVFVSMLGKDLK
jgi:hypothetical protein